MMRLFSPGRFISEGVTMYKISSSEERNEKASDFETYSLLYVINFYPDADDTDYLVIDFFNDVTGVSRNADSCVDVQSKGLENMQPAELGKSLVTLFKNYLSDFSSSFKCYILFVNGVSLSVKKCIGERTEFSIGDLSEPIKKSVVSALAEEAKKKTYIETKKRVNESEINAFLTKVLFVINSYTKEQYIRLTAKLNESVVIDDAILRKIFKEIRDRQSSKKNNNVEGQLLSSVGDFVKFDKWIKKEAIENLVLCRICFKRDLDSMKKSSIPASFVDVYQSIDVDRREETLDDCKNAIYRLLYNKNNGQAFWALFSQIVRLNNANPGMDAGQLYLLVDRSLLAKIHELDILSAKYFIALVKEGLGC